MKMAPVILELDRRQIACQLVHTGQHYDAAMSDVFFAELGLRAPDLHLGVGSGSHAHQTAGVMMGLEKAWSTSQPRLVVVAGDVNSTMAAAITAAKLAIPIAHVEAGLRSFDRTMPEEVNRIVTDRLASVLFTTEPSANRHLAAEGVPAERVHYVGNSMIDSLQLHVTDAVARAPWRAHGLQEREYGLVTLHRPSNVDDDQRLQQLFDMLERLAERVPLVFPLHPRTRARLQRHASSRVLLLDALPYLEFLGLMARAKVVITDSGGIQEETTALQVPCVTVRENTERPSTVEEGTNILAGTDPARVEAVVLESLSHPKQGRVPHLWDGHAGKRIVDVLQAMPS